MNWYKRKIEKKFLEIYGNFIGGLRCGNEGQDKKKEGMGLYFLNVQFKLELFYFDM